MKRDICYATLAIGYEYRKHAESLARDIENMSPEVPLIVLTDYPQAFRTFKNAIAIKHIRQSAGIYHDKLLCLERGFQDFDCVIFLDADCRLLNDFAYSREWKSGITPVTCWSFKKHFPQGIKFSDRNPNKYHTKKKKRDLAYSAAKNLGVTIEECMFVYEGAFVVRKDAGKETAFVELWKQLRGHFESDEIYDGEGVSMGLSAKKSGLKVHHYISGYPEVADDAEHRGVYKDKLFYKLLIHNDKDGLSEETCKRVIEFDNQRKRIADLPFPMKVMKKTSRLTSKIRRKLRFQEFIVLSSRD